MALRPQFSVAPMPKMKRTMRSPQHSWVVAHRPWQIQPFCIAPVRPGETLQFINWQARCVTQPIKSPLVGWWLNYYWFYVKFRDLAERDTVTSMMIDPTTDVTGIDDTTDSLWWYHAGTLGNINWTKLCTIAVVEEYFREEGEAWNDHLMNDLPVKRLRRNGWWDSATPDSAYTAPDFNVDLDADTNIMASEVDKALEQYQLLVMQGLTTQTYEEYLATFGVRAEQAEQNVPELIRWTQDWQYPANTIDPTDGTPRSAVSWSIQQRSDKSRYFSQPGFVLGLTVAEPKVYMSNQGGSLSSYLNDAYAWLPATVNNPRLGMRQIPNTNALVDGQTEDLWFDVHDLFMYGDQYLQTGADDWANAIALPTAAGGFKYATDTMADTLFVDAVGGAKYIYQDGNASLGIKGTVTDPYPGSG